MFPAIVESTLMFACDGDQIGMAKLVQGYRLSAGAGHYLQTKSEGKKSIKLKVTEVVLKVISSLPPEGLGLILEYNRNGLKGIKISFLLQPPAPSLPEFHSPSWCHRNFMITSDFIN